MWDISTMAMMGVLVTLGYVIRVWLDIWDSERGIRECEGRMRGAKEKERGNEDV